jgi:alkyl hydroperoxide reductase subunit D
VRGHGATVEQVQATVRIAAVVHATAATLDGESAAAAAPLSAAA